MLKFIRELGPFELIIVVLFCVTLIGWAAIIIG